MTQPAVSTEPAGAPRPHVHEFHVRFRDIDSYGHVNNCTYLAYLEDARVAMFFTDPVREGRAPLRDSIIARHEIDYKRPLLFRPEPVRVETRVTGLRTASFALAHEVRDDQHVYARASSTVVGYDLGRSRPRRLDDGERALLGEYLR